MIPFLLLLYRFMRTLWRGFRDPEFRGLLTAAGVALGLGTWFYMRFEHWSLLDSLYFTVITLTTVGYGDIHPLTNIGKIFTMLYVLVGIAIFSAFGFLLAERSGLIKHD